MSDLAGMKIAVLLGGPGSEREVSLKSGESVHAALASLGADVVDVDVKGPDFVIPEGTDIGFNVIHGTFGEDGTLQAILDARGIPYTGAGAASSRLAMDKQASKERFVARNVPTPAFEMVDLRAGETPSIPIPYVAKPPREGSSVGVHIVQSPEEAATALADVQSLCRDALIEEFVEGKELTVGVLGAAALPVVHICPLSGFYDISNKYPWLDGKGKTEYHVPADLPDEVTREVQACGLAAHQSLGVEVYSRVDVLLSADNRPYVLEVNTIPGMTESSLLPKAAQAAGLDFSNLCARIVELSLAQRVLS